ncbi:MAG: phenylalanine--tRNA ligase subunit alpha [Cytophagales bacterium]|nr:phenylalanine--tRNA ligase subunit alpha [Bernardetiaceae bacterium]MDW8209742.1 phenylalanine--tRNA ligase subunit alpha [Cytophagales bacterium]
MLDRINEILKQVEAFSITSKEELEQFRLKYIAKKGIITLLFEEFKSLPPEEKRQLGQPLNQLKEVAVNKLKAKTTELEAAATTPLQKPIDLTLPVVPHELGTIHPLTQVWEQIVEIFSRIGFNLEEGPEIETDWNNFTALNFPENHPAREMQDTFFIEGKEILLRTHTSNVQIRLMNRRKPPIRSIMPGRVYRNETISARAHCIFHQVEGLYVDRNVSFLDLKQTLYHFAKELFGKETRVRFRPSYFPFTEPSAEIDISCGLNQPTGCQLCGGSKNICKGTGWVEIGGAGMVHPNVLANCHIDPETYTGFAFGMGIERIAMLKYHIRDLRLFTENDVRFLRQF